MSAGKKSTIGNPLRTRVIRELRTEWRKYIVIFIFLTLMIGFISGVYVANNSMLMATERVKQDMIREDGHFILKEKADDDLVADIEEGDKVNVRAYYVYDAYDDIDADDIKEAYRSGNYKENLKKLYEDADKRARENYENAVGDYELDDPYFRPVPVKLFENFRKDTDEDIDLDGTRDSGVRVYINRDDINLYCLMDGKDATNENEIVIDRMHADNNGIKTGDKINIGGADFTVTGLVAFSNYSTLHEKGTDMMFDALTFDIAMTTREGWDRINAEPEYEYAWLYQNPPENEKEQRRLSENFLKALITQAAFAENPLEKNPGSGEGGRPLQSPSAGAAEASSAIEQINSYIHANYMHDIGLTELSDMVSMNPAYLSVLFKDRNGISFIKYLTRVRLEKARELLAKGAKTAEAAEAVGYHDAHYFSEIFKKNTGMTPSEYKDSLRAQQ